MKALVQTAYGSSGAAALGEVPEPVARAGELLVRVHAAGLNASDRLLLRGEPFAIRALGGGLRRPRAGFVVGRALAGRVQAVGAGVEGFAVGDDVFAEWPSAIAELVAVPARLAAHKPAALTYEEAAALPVAASTALQGIRTLTGVTPAALLNPRADAVAGPHAGAGPHAVGPLLAAGPADAAGSPHGAGSPHAINDVADRVEGGGDPGSVVADGVESAGRGAGQVDAGRGGADSGAGASGSVVAEGMRLLITGASGGVGSFAVQLAVAAGATVTAVCAARNADLVRSLGATRVIDYERAGDQLGGLEFDAVFDLTGNYPISVLRRALASGGTILLSVGTGGRWVGPARRILRAMTSGGGARPLTVRPSRDDLTELATLVEAGRIRPVIDRVYPFEEATAALGHIDKGRVSGKLVITGPRP